MARHLMYLLSAFFSFFSLLFFFFNYTAPPEIYPLSLHDALPILAISMTGTSIRAPGWGMLVVRSSSHGMDVPILCPRSEEHTSELQSRGHLVCRLLLEKKKKYTTKKI